MGALSYTFHGSHCVTITVNHEKRYEISLKGLLKKVHECVAQIYFVYGVLFCIRDMDPIKERKKQKRKAVHQSSLFKRLYSRNF